MRPGDDHAVRPWSGAECEGVAAGGSVSQKRMSGNVGWLEYFRATRPLGQIHFERQGAEEKGSGSVGKKNLDIFLYRHILKAWQGRRQPRMRSMPWRNRGGGTS